MTKRNFWLWFEKISSGSATVPKLFLILIPGSGDAIYMRISSHGFHCSLAHQATISTDFVQSCFACKIFLDSLNIIYIFFEKCGLSQRLLGLVSRQGSAWFKIWLVTGYHWLQEFCSQGAYRLPLVTLILVSGWLPVTTGYQNFRIRVVTGYYWLPLVTNFLTEAYVT